MIMTHCEMVLFIHYEGLLKCFCGCVRDRWNVAVKESSAQSFKSTVTWNAETSSGQHCTQHPTSISRHDLGHIMSSLHGDMLNVTMCEGSIQLCVAQCP